MITTSHRFGVLRVALGVLITIFAGQRAGAAEPAPRLTYHFHPGELIAYEVTVEADFSDASHTVTGTSFYSIKRVNEVNGHVALSNYGSFADQTEAKPQDQPFPRPLFRRGGVLLPGAMADLTVDAQGNRVSGAEGSQLPWLLGPLPALAVPPLARDAQPSWQAQRQIKVVQFPFAGMIGGPHLGPQPHSDHTARETSHFSIAAVDGAAVTVHRTFELVTNDTAAKGPLYKLTGEGDLVFDIQAGRFKTVNMKYMLEVNRGDTSARAPVYLTARLLSPEQAKRAAADRQAKLQPPNVPDDNGDRPAPGRHNGSGPLAGAHGESHAPQSPVAAAAPRDARPEEVRDLPAGSTATSLIGGNGGSPFVLVDPDGATVIGLQYTLGSWGGAGCLSSLKPIYQRQGATTAKPFGANRNRSGVILAREGFVVAGLAVQRDQTNVTAIRVIFQRAGASATTHAPGDRYQSDWIGFHRDGRTDELAGKGEMVLGVFGRHGMNLDALGLVVRAQADAGQH